jgi:hypothetical protein
LVLKSGTTSSLVYVDGKPVPRRCHRGFAIGSTAFLSGQPGNPVIVDNLGFVLLGAWAQLAALAVLLLVVVVKRRPR